MRYTTSSLTARCRRTGRFGVAVATRVPMVGAAVPHLRAGVGAIASQAWTNPYIDLRVDEHADPIPGLHRVYEAWDEVFRPHLAARPTRADLGARACSERPRLSR